MLSSNKIDKYEYLTSEEILLSDWSIMIEQAKFNYSSFGKAFEIQRKMIEDATEKQTNKKNNWRCSWKTNKGFKNFKHRSTVKINKFIDKFTPEKNL